MPDDLTTRINALPPEFEAVREWQHELRTAAAVYIFGLETALAIETQRADEAEAELEALKARRCEESGATEPTPTSSEWAADQWRQMTAEREGASS